MTVSNTIGSVTSDPIEVIIVQNGASVVDGFVSPSATGNINDILVLPGDRVLVGGDFFSFNSIDFSVQGGRYLAVMEKDGTVVPDTGITPNNRVQALAMQDDGKIIVAGTFSQIWGTNRKQIARLNADLTLDETFDPGDLFPGFATIYNVVIDHNGKILVVHSDRGLNYLVRLLSDGTQDPDFTVAPSSLVREIIPQDDGTYFVAGYFLNWDQMNPLTDSYLVKIANDGTLISPPEPNTSTNRVNELFQLSDGTLLAHYNNFALELFTTDGVVVADRFQDLVFNSTVGVFSEAEDGRMYLGGFFTETNGAATNRLIRTTSNGDIDPAFNTGTGFNSGVNALAQNDDGTLWVAGSFTQYNGSPASYITLLSGTLEPPAVPSYEDFISDTNLDVQDQGFDSDPDFDGFANGLEFLLSGNPEVTEYDLLPAPILIAGADLGIDDGQDYLTMEVTVATSLVDLPWSVQASSDLTFSGNDLESAVQVGEPTSEGDFTTYLFRTPWPVQDSRERGFLRLSVSP